MIWVRVRGLLEGDIWIVLRVFGGVWFAWVWLIGVDLRAVVVGDACGPVLGGFGVFGFFG